MHPIFSSAKNLFAVAGLWLALSGMISYFLHLILGMSLQEALLLFTPFLFFYFFLCLPNYYLGMRLSIRQTNFLRLVSTQLIALATTVVIWLLLGFAYVYFLHKKTGLDWFTLYWDSLALLGIIAAMLYCFWILAHYVYLMAEQHDVMMRADLQKKLLINQAELQTLKVTVHPHFLFNSLTMLANLALSEPEKVHGLCLQISAFLRYSVSYSRKPMATVEEELAHIQNYLAIERERFGTRLRTVFEIEEDVRSESMLPLLLFPLVENSIKHGIDSCLEGGTVTIRMMRRGATLLVHIENPYDELGRKVLGAHLGLESVKKRLQVHYGGAGRFQLTRGKGQFSVDLGLPLDGASHG